MQRNNRLDDELTRLMYEEPKSQNLLKAYQIIKQTLLLDPVDKLGDKNHSIMSKLKIIAKITYPQLKEKDRILKYIENDDPLLLQSLNPETALGKVFWKPPSLSIGCSLEKGTLKKICEILVSRNVPLPNQVKNTEEKTVSITTQSVFGGSIKEINRNRNSSPCSESYEMRPFQPV